MDLSIDKIGNCGTMNSEGATKRTNKDQHTQQSITKQIATEAANRTTLNLAKDDYTEICTNTHWDEPTENTIEYVANMFKEKKTL